MSRKEYLDKNGLNALINKIKEGYAKLVHSHTISEITDYTVDTELSSTSENPVQNKVLDAEFNTISDALKIYGIALDDKASKEHVHEISDINELQTKLDELDSNIVTTWDELENKPFGSEVIKRPFNETYWNEEYNEEYDTVNLSVTTNSGGINNTYEGDIPKMQDQYVGQALIVLDGVEYKVNFVEYDDNTKHMYCAGNRNIIDSSLEDTGEPFYIYSQWIIGEYVTVFRLVTRDTSPTTHIISLYAIEEIVEQLDVKYIPEHNHDWDNIEDKPFYEEFEVVVDQWWGVTDGREVGGIDGGELFYHISDYIIDKMILEKYYFETMYGDGFISAAENMLPSDDCYIGTYGEEAFAFVLKDNVSAWFMSHTFNFPKAGVYFTKNSKDYICNLHIVDKQTLDEKHIPDTIARITYVDDQLEAKSDSNHNHDDIYETKEDAQVKYDTITEAKADKNHAHSWNDLTDKPFSEIVSKEEIWNGSFTSEIVNTDFSNSTTIILEEEKSIVDSDWDGEYSVIYDGISYNNLTSFDLDDGFYIGIGNASLYDSSLDNTGEPFLIRQRIYGSFDVSYDDTVSTEHSLTIYKTGESEIIQLDEKFIPNVISRNGHNHSFKDIYNMDSSSETVLVYEDTLENGDLYDLKLYELYKNNVHIILNGEEYESTCIIEGVSYTIRFGDYEISQSVAEAGAAILFPTVEGETYDIKIYVTKETITIPEKYIPDTIARVSDIPEIVQPDWNQNDETAKDHIKNKPFYEEIVETGELETIYDGELNSANTGGIGMTGIDLYTGEIYCDILYVDFDSVTYKLIKVEDTPERMYWHFESADGTELPFHIEADELDYTVYVRFDVSTIHTLVIKRPVTEKIIHQLDSKFIPDTIARKSDIPQSDWNQTDETASDYIKNKPFFSIGSTNEIITNEYEPGDEHYWEAKDVSFTATPITNQNYSLGILGDYNIEIGDGFIAGERYNVIFDSVSYDCTAIEPHDDGDVDGAAIGNKSIIDSTAEDTGEPFYIYKYFERFGYYRIYQVHTKDTEETTHIISLYRIVDNVKQIDEKFIPDTIARTSYVDENFALKSDLENVDLSGYETKDDAQLKYDTIIEAKSNKDHTHSWSDLKDRPFYSVVCENWVNTFEDWTIWNFTENEETPGLYGVSSDTTPDFTIGKEIKIIWDSVEYICVSSKYDEEAADMFNQGAVGNRSIIDSTAANTGEPFFMYIDNFNVTGYQVPEINIYTTESGSHEIYFYRNDGIVKEAIVDAYDAPIENVTINVKSGGAYTDAFYDEQVAEVTSYFEVGKNYSITFDGQEYRCIGKEINAAISDASSDVAIGNENIVDSTAADTGEPFYIFITMFRMNYSDYYTVATRDTEKTEHIISIYNLIVEEDIHYLDEKFIPDTIARISDLEQVDEHAWNYYQELSSKYEDVTTTLDSVITNKANASDLSAHTNNVDIHVTAEEKAKWDTQPDWDQNNKSSIDYIKNRPFYGKEDEEILTWNGDIEGLEATSNNFYWVSPIIVDESILDKYYFKLVSESEYSNCIENMNQVEDFYVGSYFAFVFKDNSSGSYMDKTYTFPKAGIYLYSLNGNSVYVKSIIVKGELKQLYEKYIPDTIARVDYVDTAIADLVGSAPETLNTIQELATAIEEHKDVTDVLDAAITNKANASDLKSHVQNTSNPHSVTKEQIGLNNVANVLQYSADNPPPYPVTSVNGKTGAVTLTSETWKFTLNDGSTVTKKVVVM